jgi:hypothetical protein
VTTPNRIAVGTSAASVAACAVCCAAPVAAFAAGAVFAPIAGVAAATALAITVAQRRRDDDLLEGNTRMSSVTNEAHGPRQLLAALLTIAAVLLLVGVAREHALRRSEAKPAATAIEPAHTEGSNEDSQATERTTAGSSVQTHSEKASEGRVLGVDIETWPIVIAFAAVSLGLAIALLRGRGRAVVVITGLVAGVAAAFDMAEIAHQLKESRTSLVVIAGAVTALHIAAVALTAMILRAEAPRQFDDRMNPVLAN